MLGKKLTHAIRRGLRLFPTALHMPVDVALSSLSYTAREWRLPGYRIRGRLVAGECIGSLVYFGDSPQYKSWISRLFMTPAAPEPIGPYSFPQIIGRKGLLAECDAILCPTTPFSQGLFPSRSWLSVPKYISCRINLRKPLDQLIPSHAANNARRVIKNKQYRFETLNSETAFEEFYHEMLVPTISARHENRANISSFEAMLPVFHRGYLLAAYQGNEWVAANLMVPQDDSILNSANIGWRDGSEQLMKDRVVSALQYEKIIRGKADGFEILDLGSSDPFVNDGPLNFKLNWGGEMIAPSPSYDGDHLQGIRSYFSVHFNIASENAQTMLKHCPVLHKYDNRLCAIGWNSVIRPEFLGQIERGLPWTDLAESTTR